MRKAPKNDSVVNKSSGYRLKQCRELRKLTQQQLADKVQWDSKYISMLENSKRDITWNNAHKLAAALDVSAEYLMCKTDIVLPYTAAHSVLDADTIIGYADKVFLLFLRAKGISIIFYVVNYHDTDRQKHGVSVDMFTDFSLSDYHCKYTDPFGNAHEGIIQEVAINNSLISFGAFIFLIIRMYDYIDFSFDNFRAWKNEYGDCIHGINGAIESELLETYCGDIGQLQSEEKGN